MQQKLKKNSTGGEVSIVFLGFEHMGIEGSRFILTLQFENDNLAAYYVSEMNDAFHQYLGDTLANLLGYESKEEILHNSNIRTDIEETLSMSLDLLVALSIYGEVYQCGATVTADPTNGFREDEGVYKFDPDPDAPYTFYYNGLVGEITLNDYIVYSEI